jgi:hypothetical protein
MSVKLLDQGNVPNTLSIADLLVRDDLDSEPREALDLLLSEVTRKGDREQVLLVCKTMLDIFSNDPVVLRSVARAKLCLGIADEAVALLESALLQTPDDIGLLQALASAYEACGDRSRASQVTREIAGLYRRSRLQVPGSGSSKHPDEDADPETGTAPSIILTDEPSTAPSIILTQEPVTPPSIVLAEGLDDGSLVLDDCTPVSGPKIII